MTTQHQRHTRALFAYWIKKEKKNIPRLDQYFAEVLGSYQQGQQHSNRTVVFVVVLPAYSAVTILYMEKCWLVLQCASGKILIRIHGNIKIILNMRIITNFMQPYKINNDFNITSSALEEILINENLIHFINKIIIKFPNIF